MTQFFLPPLDTRWRLEADWTPEDRFLNRSDNDETIWSKAFGIQQWKKATGDNTNDYAASGGWVSRYHAWEKDQQELRGAPKFVAGTVLQIERYHCSRSGENQITVKVITSPEPLLTPKKQGGRMSGAGRLYLTLADFNSLPTMEDVSHVVPAR